MTMTPLHVLALASLAPLLGPLVFFFLRDRRGPFRFLDGFVMIAVPGLIFLHVVPESIVNREPLLALALVVGLLAPGTLEHLTRDVAGRTDRLALILGVSGLALHAFMEGAAITPISGTEDLGLALAITLHRIPVGLAVWWLVRDRFGDGAAAAAVLAIVALTGTGYAGGGRLASLVGGGTMELYQAFVGGTLVHVAFHQIGHHGASRPGRLDTGLEGVGALAALGLLMTLGVFDAEGGHGSGVVMAERAWRLAAAGAPFILLAWAGTGLLHGLAPATAERWIPAHRTRARLVDRYWGPSGSASGGGIAVPVLTLLVGAEALLLSPVLLGPAVAGWWMLLAVLTALAVGVWLGRGRGWGGTPDTAPAPPAEEREGSVTVEPGAREGHVSHLRRGTPGTAVLRGMDSVRGAVDHTGPWLLLGFLLAGVVSPLVEERWLVGLPSPVTVPALAILATPFYLAVSASVPLAALFLAAGASPGAVVAFLLTAPLLGRHTMGTLVRARGRRAGWIFLAAALGGAVALGLGVDLLQGGHLLPGGGNPGPGWAALFRVPPTLLEEVALAALVLLLISSLLRRGTRRFLGELKGEADHVHAHLHPHGRRTTR